MKLAVYYAFIAILFGALAFVIPGLGQSILTALVICAFLAPAGYAEFLRVRDGSHRDA